jgi:hypothetical protein
MRRNRFLTEGGRGSCENLGGQVGSVRSVAPLKDRNRLVCSPVFVLVFQRQLRTGSSDKRDCGGPHHSRGTKRFESVLADGCFSRYVPGCRPYGAAVTRASERMEQPVPMVQSEATVPSLSTDALSMKILLQNLKPVRYTGHPLALIQRTGYLLDWTRERWDQAASELADVHRPGRALPADIGQLINARVT